ncbi:hypothetical protein [Gloeocapsopsis dulcis]|nr:hypothetical protein [Gloeocapsopsis dulcis]WNN89020.1 hypothetical protein P0S91_22655 [Gloeocapsopsis dulcis]
MKGNSPLERLGDRKALLQADRLGEIMSQQLFGVIPTYRLNAWQN